MGIFSSKNSAEEAEKERRLSAKVQQELYARRILEIERERVIRFYEQEQIKLRQAELQKQAVKRHEELRKAVISKNDRIVSPWKRNHNTSAIYWCEELSTWSAEYKAVNIIFRSSGKRTMQILKIEKIHNPYTEAIYSMKKLEHPKQEELDLFHGTPVKYAHNICSTNFNYRLCGRGVGTRYGKGLSFTPISYYATHYCGDTDKKVMFLCKVLVGNQEPGHKEMVVPHSGYDTSYKLGKNGKTDVYVKFDDDVFYPMYKITFCMTEQEEARSLIGLMLLNEFAFE